MDEIENIPADQVLEMTPIWHRAFNAGGCDPMCHNCEKMLAVGQKFKLATVLKMPSAVGYDLKEGIRVLQGSTTKIERWGKIEHVGSHEVMLCAQCTPEMFRQTQIKKLKTIISDSEQKKYERRGCFRVNGKIVK